MSLYKRPNSRYWWAKIRLPDGGCVCRSSGTAKREEAQEWLDHTRAGLWRVHRLGERPTYTWQDAVVRWTEEKAEKATALEDRVKFQWLDGYLRGRLLHTITRDDVQAIGAAKARETSRATANRYLALVRAVLKRAAGPWQWIEKAPAVSLYLEAKRRVRWLTKQEATRLLDALPTHQKQLTRFALATGLRQANVLALKWPDVDIERRTAWVHADEAKGGEAIGVPLNDEAVAVLREELGKHPLRVFTFNGRPLGQANTRAWEECAQARWHQEFPLARFAARMGDLARDGRYNHGGTAGTRGVEIRRDGEALRAPRAGATTGGGGQSGYIFVYTAEKRNAGINASY